MDAVTGMIQSQVVQAVIKWIMGLLTPAGAFVKAAMAIIDVVKFFVQRAAQIMELVQAFIIGVKAVASGSVKAVASAIENALAKAVPVVIGFLAALLGLGGLAQKVIAIFKKIHDRGEKGLIALWTKIKSLGASLLNKITGKDKGKDKNLKDERTTEQKQKDLEAGIKEGTTYLKSSKHLKKSEIDEKLNDISGKHQLVELKLVIDKHEETGKDLVHIHGKVNPEKDGDKIEIDLEEGTALKASDIPVKEKDLIKAKYIKGKFLADVTKIHEPTENEKEDFVKHKYRYKKLDGDKEQKNTFKQFLEKWKNGDIEKVNEERKYLIENRPSYKTGVAELVWENAKDSKGRVFDENIDKELFWDINKSRFDQWHMGHRQKHKYSDLVDRYIDGYLSWDEFLKEYNDENKYIPEDPKSNMSHKFE